MTSGKGTAFDTIRYEVDGPVCTITLNRPEVANAQDTQLLDELDAGFDLADEDDDVRVVVLAGEGKHFSAGHDLKQLRKPTIAAVQGACSAAGLMLACMCDLIVAGDDAAFSNPVLRMTGAGVELLVEPWELGPRKAKEFLLCAETIDARDAERLGLVNKVVPRAELAKAARDMADKVALVPPVTAQAVKDSINRMLDFQGQRESWRYHFMVHQFVSNTATALGAMEARKRGGMDAVRAEQRGEGPPEGG
jgi:enoyl-CoA hydratase